VAPVDPRYFWSVSLPVHSTASESLEPAPPASGASGGPGEARGLRALFDRFGAPLLLLILLVLGYRGLVDFSPIAAVNENRLNPVEGQLFVPNQKSPLLIFAIASLFFVQRSVALRRCIREGAWTGWSFPLLASGIAFNVLAHRTETPFLAVVSLSLTALGGAALLGGLPALRRMRLPALFLLLALPIPGFLLNSIVYPLQLATAEMSGLLLSLMSVDHVVTADLIYTKTAVFQVIEGCSGLRSTETLLMAAIVYQYWVFHSRACSWLLVLSAPLIGIVVNQLRVLWIIFYPSSSASSAHTMQGLVMIVVGVLLIDRVHAILSRWLPAERTPSDALCDGATAPGSWPARAFVLLAALLMLNVATTFMEPWPVDRPLHKNPAQFPGQIDGWTVKADPIDEEFFGSTRHTQVASRTYRREEEEVSVFIAVDSRTRPLASGISPKNARVGKGWTIVATSAADLANGDDRATVSIQRSQAGLAYVIHWQQGVDVHPLEALRNALALDRSPWQRPYDAISFRISTPLDGTDLSAIERADARTAPFVELARETFPVPEP